MRLSLRLFQTYQEDFPVEGAMRTDFPRIGPNDPVIEALNRMRAEGFKAVPVVDRGRLVGMLTMEDISEAYSLLHAGGPDILRRVTDSPVK